MSATRASLAIGIPNRKNRSTIRPSWTIRRNQPDSVPGPKRGLQLTELDLMSDEPERERGHQVDQQVAEEIRHPVRRQRQLECELEKEDRADRQVGPGEEPMLPRGESRG